MKRTEFESLFRSKGISLKANDIYVGEKNCCPFAYGCYEENGKWVGYSNSERQETSILLVADEDRAFDYFESIVTGELEIRGVL